MLQCGAISGNMERPPIQKQLAAGGITPVHDLNVPYEGPLEEYETPTAEMLFPPVSSVLEGESIPTELSVRDSVMLLFGCRLQCRHQFQLHCLE